MSSTATTGIRLDHPVLALDLGPRGRQACAQLGVTTVAQFLAIPATDFVARSGCSQKTWTQIEQRVVDWLTTTAAGSDRATADDDQRPLDGLVRDPAAERAFLTLGITTVGQFLATPKETLLACAGFRERTWQSIRDKIQATRKVRAAGSRLLPQVMLDLPLGRLALARPLIARLERLGAQNLGQALSLPETVFATGGELGADAAAAIRSCLEQLFRVALEQVDLQPESGVLDWPTLKGQLLAPLQEQERELLTQLVGLGQPPRTVQDLAVTRHLDATTINALADRTRQRLHERTPSLMCRLRFEMARELDTFEGVVDGTRLAPGTLLHTIGRANADPTLPLRLLAFCFPREFWFQDNVLTTLSRRDYKRLVQTLRETARPHRLPLPIDQIVAEVATRVAGVPRGLLLHVLRASLRLTIQIDPRRGEVATQSQHAPAVRLRHLLLEQAAPMALEDLVFAWRERYRTVSARALERTLRADPTFVAIGPSRWSLRAWHQDELQTAATIAAELATRVLEAPGKHHVPAMLQGRELGEVMVWLVIDCLRRDPQVRYLGRGDVCPATHTRSSVLDQLLKDFRRAGGDVVMSRFLDNQSSGKRRLVERLLHENRMFVIPAEDRIDLLANYPFNGERLARLLDVVQGVLRSRHGYAPLGLCMAEVNRSDLGGLWMNEVILGELLHRHGRFELLPGGIVARRDLELGGWLMQKARAALRAARMPISVAEILAQRPELAEFSATIAQLLRTDPMVRSDGAKFVLV